MEPARERARAYAHGGILEVGVGCQEWLRDQHESHCQRLFDISIYYINAAHRRFTCVFLLPLDASYGFSISQLPNRSGFEDLPCPAQRPTHNYSAQIESIAPRSRGPPNYPPRTSPLPPFQRHRDISVVFAHARPRSTLCSGPRCCTLSQRPEVPLSRRKRPGPRGSRFWTRSRLPRLLCALLMEALSLLLLLGRDDGFCRQVFCLL